jgi:hypothetical protein
MTVPTDKDLASVLITLACYVNSNVSGDEDLAYRRLLDEAGRLIAAQQRDAGKQIPCLNHGSGGPA